MSLIFWFLLIFILLCLTNKEETDIFSSLKRINFECKGCGSGIGFIIKIGSGLNIKVKNPSKFDVKFHPVGVLRASDSVSIFFWQSDQYPVFLEVWLRIWVNSIRIRNTAVLTSSRYVRLQRFWTSFEYFCLIMFAIQWPDNRVADPDSTLRF